MAVTKSSDVSSSYLAAEYLSQKIGPEAASQTFIADLIHQESTVGKDTMVAHLRNLVPFSVPSTVTEGAALTVSTWAPSGKTITASQKGFSVQPSKVLDSISPSALPQIVAQLGTTLARLWDTDIAALFTSLTAGPVGAFSTALTLDMITQAIAYLDANFAQGPKNGVIGTQAWYDLVKDIGGKNFGISCIKTIVEPDTGRSLKVMDLEGCLFRTSGLVSTTWSGTGQVGALFTQDALAITVAQQPKVEIFSLPGQNAYTVDASVAYGVATFRPTFGCALFSGDNA